MQILIKKTNCGKHLNVSIPSLAMKTIAKDENDIQSAVDEAIVSFFLVSEMFGKGFKNELKEIEQNAN